MTRSSLLRLLLALAICLGLTSPLMTQTAGATGTTLTNPGFESGDLSGWTTTGTAFNGAVSDDPGWGWGCCFNQQGSYHLWGFAAGGDAPMGTVTSEAFTLTGTGMVSALVSGGRNENDLYVALTTLDGTVLHKATGTDDETYRRVIRDARDHFTGPSGTVDDKGRSLVFSIAQDRRTERAHYDAGWAHNAGLPIELSMRPDADLGFRPVEEVSRLHTGEPLLDISEPTSLTDANARLAGIKGDMLHIKLTLERGSAGTFGLDVLRSPGDEERTRLFYDAPTGQLGVDRTRSGNNSSAEPHLGIHKGPLTLSNGSLTLDVFLDRSMIEAYANNHKSITTRAYPFRQDSLGLRLFGDGSIVKSMTVWKMGNMTD
ncbi:glycoside hydrolase family 32 protein [Streptomyces hirsutus]|uniref:glycoside hydrolase family 32 protein n=1 Tax=Streptomyces hirsutus TaxID=35620 RepID=UPI0014707DE3|nr:glycoside hydrolase family 32 protein [Streptomyces hirsutus]